MHIGDEMENKDIVSLKAEIERFKTESLKTHIVKVWAESYTNSDPFGYAILENENNKVWWMKTQAHQLWEMWQAAKKQATPEGFVLVSKEMLNKSKRVVTLTCSELLEAFQFGAPDGENDEDQMATEMTIEWFEDGHSGKGYYAYYSELPEEGAIKLGEEQSHD